MRPTRIYVSPQRIAIRSKAVPPILVSVDDATVYASDVELIDDLGRVVARVVYDPTKPAGEAAVWIETTLTLRTKD